MKYAFFASSLAGLYPFFFFFFLFKLMAKIQTIGYMVYWQEH